MNPQQRKTMKTILLSVVTLAALLSGLPVDASCTFCAGGGAKPAAVVARDFSGVKGVAFVRTSLNSGYYVVSPQGTTMKALGLQNAPYVDSDNAARSGVGLDSIAFRFGPDGRLDQYPMYISQLAPDSAYTLKLRGLARGHSTLALVDALFDGQTVRVEKQGSRTLAYVELPVYNPLTSGS